MSGWSIASPSTPSTQACLQSHNQIAEEDDPGDEAAKDKNPLRDVSPIILEELKHLDLSGRVTFSNNVIGSGYWGDICKAYYDLPDGRKSAVVMKRLRFYLRDDVTAVCRFLLSSFVYC